MSDPKIRMPAPKLHRVLKLDLRNFIGDNSLGIIAFKAPTDRILA